MKFSKVFLLCFVLAFTFSCSKAAQKRKDRAEIHYQTAQIKFESRNYTDALKEVENAIELNDDEKHYYYLLAHTFFAMKMYEKAGENFVKTLEMDPEMADARMNLGVSYIELGFYDKSIVEFQRVLDNVYYPSKELTYNNIGWAYYKQGKYNEAIINYKRSVEKNKDYSMGYYNMGLAFEKVNKNKSAMKSFKKAIKIVPQFLLARQELALLYIKMKKKKAALKIFEEIKRDAPDSEFGQTASDYIKLIK